MPGLRDHAEIIIMIRRNAVVGGEEIKRSRETFGTRK